MMTPGMKAHTVCLPLNTRGQYEDDVHHRRGRTDTGENTADAYPNALLLHRKTTLLMINGRLSLEPGKVSSMPSLRQRAKHVILKVLGVTKSKAA